MRCPMLVVLFGCGSLLAQAGSFTLPSKALDSEPDKVWNDSRPTQLFAFMNNSVLRTQVLYAQSDILVAAAQLNSLSFRHAHQHGSPGGSFGVRIDLSLGPRLPSQASRAFDSNHGSPRTTVFQGGLNLPSRPSGSWPQPWEAPIAFATPFPYQSGAASLVLDVTVSAGTVPGYIAEAYGRELGWYGDVFRQPASCATYLGNSNGGLNAYRSELCPGGVLDFYLYLGRQDPTLANNVMLLSAYGPGDVYLGRVLPFSIASLGIPAAQGCSWTVGFDGPSTVLAYRINGTTCELVPQSPIPIPSDPRLAGAILYSQVAALDQSPFQPLRLFTTVATEWRLGPGTTVPAATVHGAGQPMGGPPVSGTVDFSKGISARFGY